MLRHAPFDSEPVRQAIYLKLWKAARAGRIPPVWVDNDCIRMLSGDQLSAVGIAEAKRILAGEPVASVLPFRAVPYWENRWMAGKRTRLRVNLIERTK